MGGVPRYYVAKEDEILMQVPDEVKKCIMFIGGNTNNGMVWRGTGFFVGVPIKGIERGYFRYIVTAKHIIEKIKYHTIDNKVTLRLNNKNGIAITYDTSLDDWDYHPTDDTIDAAVLPLNLSEADYDFLVIVDEHAITKEKIMQDAIGVGDDVFITGLFSKYIQTKKVLPVVRVGNIALMPDEKVCITIYSKEKGDEVKNSEVYLIEARSIGGVSGSPVFVSMGLWRSVKKVTTHGSPSGKSFHWFGLMHGHWKSKKGEIDAIMDEKEDQQAEKHTGIAIVVPAVKILEIINQDKFMKDRKKIEDEISKRNLPTADAVEITKEEFQRTLEKVSKKITPSEPDPSKPKT